MGSLGSEGPSLEPQLLAGKLSVGSTEYSQCRAPCRPHLPTAWEPLPCDAQSKPGKGLEPQAVLGAMGKEAVAPAHLLPPSTLLVLGAPRLLLPPLCPPLTCVPPEHLAQRRMPAPPGRPQVLASPLFGPGGPGGNGHVENSLWAPGTCSHMWRGQPVTCLPQAASPEPLPRRLLQGPYPHPELGRPFMASARKLPAPSLPPIVVQPLPRARRSWLPCHRVGWVPSSPPGAPAFLRTTKSRGGGWVPPHVAEWHTSAPGKCDIWRVESMGWRQHCGQTSRARSPPRSPTQPVGPSSTLVGFCPRMTKAGTPTWPRLGARSHDALSRDAPKPPPARTSPRPADQAQEGLAAYLVSSSFYHFPGPPRLLIILGNHRDPQRGPWSLGLLGIATCSGAASGHVIGWEARVGPRPQPAPLPAPQVLTCAGQPGPIATRRAHCVFLGRCPTECARGVVITAVLRRDAHSPSLWQLGNKKKAQVLSIRPPPWGSLILGSADTAVRAHHPSLPSESHTLACWGPACRIPRREKTASSDPGLWVFTPWRSPPSMD